MNKSKLHHVWYSQKQFDFLESANQKINQAILEGGTFVTYTELTPTKKMSSLWDDYVYLGKGRWHKVLK